MHRIWVEHGANGGGDQHGRSFTDLSHWDDDSIVVVHVLPSGVARVRLRTDQDQAEELPLGEALEQARFSLNLPIREQVAVYLEDDSLWEDRYGELVRYEA